MGFRRGLEIKESYCEGGQGALMVYRVVFEGVSFVKPVCAYSSRHGAECLISCWGWGCMAEAVKMVGRN